MTVTLHTPKTIYTARHMPSWFFLAFAAGGVNGFAFLACEQFVTHVTGTATRIGLEWPRFDLAAQYAAVVLCFVAGATASVMSIQGRILRGKQPSWATPLLWVAAILASVAIAGRLGGFGSFGAAPNASPPLVLLALLAFAMGLQNATVASTTGKHVRTTHLTGAATDLGIHLGAAWFLVGTARREAFRTVALRGGKIIAFTAGAGLALPLTAEFGFLALLAPSAFILAAAALSFDSEWKSSNPQVLSDASGPR